jgi:hypothetical protein
MMNRAVVRRLSSPSEGKGENGSRRGGKPTRAKRPSAGAGRTFVGRRLLVEERSMAKKKAAKKAGKKSSKGGKKTAKKAMKKTSKKSKKSSKKKAASGGSSGGGMGGGMG